jgi:hypothetical protein
MQSDLTTHDESEALFDGSETIFDALEEVTPRLSDSVCCDQCSSYSARLLEPVQGGQYMQLNDLEFRHADT